LYRDHSASLGANQEDLYGLNVTQLRSLLSNDWKKDAVLQQYAGRLQPGAVLRLYQSSNEPDRLTAALRLL
jgi:hypothetical protein